MTYKNRKAKGLTKRDEKKLLNSNTYKFWKTEWLTKTYRDRMSFKYLQKKEFSELQRWKLLRTGRQKDLLRLIHTYWYSFKTPVAKYWMTYICRLIAMFTTD